MPVEASNHSPGPALPVSSAVLHLGTATLDEQCDRRGHPVGPQHHIAVMPDLFDREAADVHPRVAQEHPPAGSPARVMVK